MYWLDGGMGSWLAGRLGRITDLVKEGFIVQRDLVGLTLRVLGLGSWVFNSDVCSYYHGE